MISKFWYIFLIFFLCIHRFSIEAEFHNRYGRGKSQLTVLSHGNGRIFLIPIYYHTGTGFVRSKACMAGTRIGQKAPARSTWNENIGSGRLELFWQLR